MIRSVTLSKIFYRLNVGRLGGDTIPLGAVALLNDDAKACSYLVLLARESLSKPELAKMDWIAQKVLTNPLEYLRHEIDELLKERVSDDLFDRLSQKLKWSTYASPPSSAPIREAEGSKIAEALEEQYSRLRQVVAPKKVGALALIAGPEFQEEPVAAYAPEAWMFPDRKTDAGELGRGI